MWEKRADREEDLLSEVGIMLFLLRRGTYLNKSIIDFTGGTLRGDLQNVYVSFIVSSSSCELDKLMCENG